MKDSVQISVNKQEKNLLELIHRIKFGELKIQIHDSMPTMVEQFVKSIDL